MITIICADSRHEGRVVRLARFEREAEGWTFSPPSPVRQPGGAVRWGDYVRLAEPAQAIQDGEPLLGLVAGRALKDGTAQERFDLRCKLCGATLPVRAQTLKPILDRADAAGVSDLPLSAIAAKLKKVRPSRRR